MKRAHMIAALTAQLLVAGFAEAIQTGKVDLGAQGSYDGTVWITRDTSGSMVFHDQRIGTSVTLSQLHSAQRDHGGLSGLADDDHSHYLNWARHWQTHTADYNDELAIPPDVGNNVTLGGHIADGNIHLLRDSAQIITGTWRFTGTPVFAPSLLIEPQPPNLTGMIDFGAGYDAPRICYEGNRDEFQFTRPIRTTSGTLTDLYSSRLRVFVNLDGRGVTGQPNATLTNFVSVNGIEAANLLNRSANEDISGQWDFFGPIRVFDQASALGIAFTTQTEQAEVGGKFSRIETTSHSIALMLDKYNNYPAAMKRFALFAGDHAANSSWALAAQGDSGSLRFGRNSDGLSIVNLSVDGNGPVLGYSTNNRTAWQSGGDIAHILNTNNGSTYVRIKDSSLTDQWVCDSDGKTSQTGTLVIDGRNSAPYASAFVVRNLGSTPSRGLDLSNSGLSGAGDYFLYLNDSNYWRADGGLKVNNGVLYVDPTTSRVGIGTTAPSGLFHAQYSSTNSISFNANVFTIRNDSINSPPTLRLQNSAGYGVGNLDFFTYAGQTVPTVRWQGVDTGGASGAQVFYTATGTYPGMSLTERMRIAANGTTTIDSSSNTFVVDAVNHRLGIRTNNTHGILTLDSNAADGQGSAANGLFFQSSLAGAHGAIYNDGEPGGKGALVFATNSTGGGWTVTEKMRLSSSGKLGIGTASPTAVLDVNGVTGHSQLRMRTSYTPTGTNDTNGNVGDMAWDDNYIYLKTSAGWKRTALSTF